MEIYTDVDKVDEIVRTNSHTAHQGMSSDDIIVVLPVKDLLHICEFKEDWQGG